MKQTMKANPVRRELIRNSLVTIAENMMVSVIRTTRSIVVKNSLDLSACILDANGQMVAQGLSLPGQLGSTMPAMAGCKEYFGDRIEDGDILCSNDPYAGAAHLNDIFMFKPIFDNGEIVAYLSLVLHHIDMGGRVAGNNAPDSTEIYQEGLRLPPSKIVQRGEPNETLLRILEANVRVSDQVMGDVGSQIASLTMGEREIRRLIQEQGTDDLRFYMADMMDHAEVLARDAIRSLGDGTSTFVDWIDDDGATGSPVRLQVKVTVNGDEIEFDYEGTSPQTSGALNPNKAQSIGTAFAVLKTVLDPNIPFNAGFSRPITVKVPEGCFLNPKFPAPVGARALGGYRLRMAILGALSKLAPDRVAACPGGSEFALLFAGYPKKGRPFLMMDFHNQSGLGGGLNQDGQDGGPWCLGNVANAPVEILEAENPIRVERYAFVPDSEGPGQYRGALGIVREYRFLAEEAIIQLRSDRQKHQPYGLFGGGAGGPGRITLLNADGTHKTMPSKFRMNVTQGMGLRAELPGSGGHGLAYARRAEDVAEDVRQQKMSIERARNIYGVVLDPKTLRICIDETEAIRQIMVGVKTPDSQEVVLS